MTQEEEKDLLLKDLCSRLPYGVRYRHFTWNDEYGETYIAAQIYSINTDGYVKNCHDDETVYIDNVRPYLFPLSSMTEEQKKEYQYITERWINDPAYSISDSIDWLNKHHFDIEVLLKKDLLLKHLKKCIKPNKSVYYVHQGKLSIQYWRLGRNNGRA